MELPQESNYFQGVPRYMESDYFPCPYPQENKKNLANISAKSRPKSEIFYKVKLWPMIYQSMKKSRVQKSHATVPLNEKDEKGLRYQ